MPQFVVSKIQNELNDRAKPLKGSRIHILGVAYKRDIADVRESPALDIIALLEKMGGEISYTDPFVPELVRESGLRISQPLEAVANSDCAVILADHSAIDYERLVQIAPLIIDTRNRLKGVSNPNIVRL